MQHERDKRAADADGNYRTFQDNESSGVDLSDYLDAHGWSWGHHGVLLAVALAKGFCGAAVSNFPFILEELEKEFSIGRAAVAAVAGCVLVGSITGCVVGGILADAIGRRRTLLFAVATGCVLTVLHVLVLDIYQLVLLRSLIGFCFGCTIGVADVWLIEFVTTEHRGWALCMGGVGWKIGALYGIGLAWYWKSSWRIMLSCNSVPGFLATVAFLFAPESPRWLVLFAPESPRWLGNNRNGGRSQDAAAGLVMQQLYGLETAPRIVVKREDEEKACQASWTDRCAKLFGNSLRYLTCTCILIWTLNVGTAYAWSLWSPEIVKELLHSSVLPYEFFMTVEVLCLVVQFVFAFVVDHFSRRKVLCLTFLFIAAVMALLQAVPHTYIILFSFVMLINLPWDLAWFVKITYTKEAFPTELRGTSSGFISGCGRVAGFVLPIWFGMLLNVSVATALWAFVAILVMLAGVSVLLPPGSYQHKLTDVVV